MDSLRAVGSGLAGALVLNAVHESVRQQLAEAPRMDVYASRAIRGSLRALGQEPPTGNGMYAAAMAGDILSNTLYYSLVGMGKSEGAPQRGALLGLAAGIGALVLPPPMGLGTAPSNRTRGTQVMTVGWYLVGGIAAGVAYRMLAPEQN